MALYLNQIFYKCNKFDNIHSLYELEKKMLNKDNFDLFIRNAFLLEAKPPLHIMETEKETKIFVELDEAAAKPPPKQQPAEEPTTQSKKPEVVAVDAIRIKEKEKENQKPITVHDNKKQSNDIFYPNREDSLFWSIFISYYGQKEFQHIGKKYANKELEEKQKIIEFIRKSPKILKESNKKLTNVMIQEIQSELMIHKESSLQSFVAFVFYYKKKVILVNGQIYLYYSFNKDELSFITSDVSLDDHVIIQYDPESSQYGIDENVTKEKINHIMETKYCIDNATKPIKGISCYKVVELEEIAKKLGVDIHHKKSDLYAEILNRCVWKK